LISLRLVRNFKTNHGRISNEQKNIIKNDDQASARDKIRTKCLILLFGKIKNLPQTLACQRKIDEMKLLTGVSRLSH
jgi:hypothetical protein